MPSDVRITTAVAAVAQPIAEFRAIIQGALTQAETFLSDQAASGGERASRAGAALGCFAAGRVDPARFASLFPTVPPVSPTAIAALHRAIATLRAMLDRGDAAFVIDLPTGGRLGGKVGEALAEFGRAFGAVILTEVVRGGRYQASEHDRLLDLLEFPAWSKAERRYAPPVVVSIDGADLHVGALSDFADGRAKMVLVVRGASAPAPLARCITPGTLVLQTTDGSGLDRVAAFDGPAIAALMPDGAAVFCHDPAAGREPWQRLTVVGLGEVPKRAISGMSAWQMAEDRNMLGDLAHAPSAAPASAGSVPRASTAEDAVEKLAAWLLGESGLKES